MVVVLVEIARAPAATGVEAAGFRENGQAANMRKLYRIGLGRPYSADPGRWPPGRKKGSPQAARWRGEAQVSPAP